MGVVFVVRGVCCVREGGGVWWVFLGVFIGVGFGVVFSCVGRFWVDGVGCVGWFCGGGFVVVGVVWCVCCLLLFE